MTQELSLFVQFHCIVVAVISYYFFQLSIYLKLRQESQLEVASQSNTLWVFSFYKLKEL